MKKGAFALLSFVISISLTIVGISIVMLVLLPSIETARASGVLNDAMEQMKVIDFSITQVAPHSKGSKATYELEVKEGIFFVDNASGTFRFKYQTRALPYFKGVLKEFGNLILIGGPEPINCSLRFGSCYSDENCIFSLFKENNSHVGNCSTYDYKVCCKILNSIFKESCTKVETKAFSLFKEQNSHAEVDKLYNISVCITPEAICELREKCLKDEACIVSFYKNFNSHAAKCNYYTNQLCCHWVVKEAIEILLKYKNIRIIGEGTFPRGRYELCIEKLDEVNATSIIKIGVC